MPPADKPEAGQDVLVLDMDESVRKGADRLLREAGFTVTLLSDIDRAKDQIANRYFPVVLADLDTPSPDAAIGLLQYVRERSPLTSVVVMSRRVDYDAVAPVFRAGAKDVVPKVREHARHLREAVVLAAANVRSISAREQLLSEFVDLNEELLRKLMDLSRQATDQQDTNLSREGGISSTAAGLAIFNVLLVDEDDAIAGEILSSLPEEKGWKIRHAHSGGEALDGATQHHPNLLVTKDILPDLPGSLVVKTVKANLSQVVAMSFTPPVGGTPGEVKILDEKKAHVLIPKFVSVSDLVIQIEKVRDSVVKKAKDRRYLKIFQTQYLDILQKCHKLKLRVDNRDGG